MNEVRLIDANALEKDFTDWYDRAYPRDKELIEIAILSVKDAPTIEAEPVKHGRWKLRCYGDYPYCSNCNNEPKGREITLFCPNCGARMDGDKNDCNNAP